MHFDAYSAFNEGEGGGNGGRWLEKVRESEKGEENGTYP